MSLSAGLFSLLALLAMRQPEALNDFGRMLRPAPPLASVDWVSIPKGTYRPLFPASPEETEIRVEPFEIAKTPVTNRDFHTFIQAHPEWRRDRVSRLFVDEGYLGHWAGPTDLGSAGAARPVTNVSWFSAKAYCEAIGARLPTEAEWEYVGAASEKQADGRKDPVWSKTILAWYSQARATPDRDVGKAPPNFFGVQDLHGLVWEWVLDFNSTMVSADSRRATENDRQTFCGSGALASTNPENYASFMRSAFRSSLEARFSAKHLGFRCARKSGKEAS